MIKTMISKIFLTVHFLVYAFLAPLLGQSQLNPEADLVIINAKIWTGDKSFPSANGVAVLGDRIVAVGSNTDVQVWRGSHTKIIDAGGKLLLPGFNDAHVHFVGGGMDLDGIELKNVTSAQEFAILSANEQN